MGRAKVGAELRTEERRSFSGRIAVVAELGKGDVDVRAVDLSAGGCYVVSTLGFQVGEVIVLSIALPDRPSLRVFGTVAHRRPAKGGFGYGVMFLDLADGERESLREACRSLPPPLPPKRGSRAPAARTRTV